MKSINVEVRGIRSLIMHKMPMGEEAKELKTITKILKKDPDNEKAYTREAELGLYQDKDIGIYVPALWFESALVKAGANEQLRGSGRKTYKDMMKAFILVEPEKIPIKPQEYEVFRSCVRIGQARITRARPLIKDWKCGFKINLWDDTISLDVFRNILDYAGSYVGVGDWRPKYGLFEVTKFEEAKLR